MDLRPAIVIVAACALIDSARAGTHDEISVGRTAENRLVAELPLEHAIPMARSVFPGFPGYASAPIGFADVAVDDPAGAGGAGVYGLSPMSSISARLTHIDAGVVLYNGIPALGAGESMDFGPPPFDYHPVWNIPNQSAMNGQLFTLWFVLHDSTGLYADSAEFAMSVTPACPGDYNLSSVVEVADILDFLGDWFSGLTQADFDHSGTVDVQDIFGFLGAWFAACP